MFTYNSDILLHARLLDQELLACFIGWCLCQSPFRHLEQLTEPFLLLEDYVTLQVEKAI